MTGRQALVHAATLRGVQALPVDVEVDITPGIPSFTIVGLGDTAVQEAKERVRAAIRSTGFEFPSARVVVNLAPAPLRKHGTGFDLPIAIGILAATGQVDPDAVSDCLAVGELSLDGKVRSVNGLLAHALCARHSGLRLLSGRMTGEAQLDGLSVVHVAELGQLRRGARKPRPPLAATGTPAEIESGPDLSEVVGQELAKRALEIAAVGDHHMLMVGPPGAGKTMLARRLPGILPPLADDERLSTALIHSVAGLDPTAALAGVRPFRSPHHTASIAGLVGGGTPLRPGEASLAHNGVLFVDEMPEFGPAALQTLRQPLEDGHITLVRADGHVKFPARFTLVGAANPCACGFQGDPVKSCICPPAAAARYATRIGGPILDRIDMCITVARVDPSSLVTLSRAESTATVRKRVAAARQRSLDVHGVSVANLCGHELLQACRLEITETDYVESLARRSHLSGRGITRVLRVARTIAHIEESSRVQTAHIAEAMAYRFSTGGVGEHVRATGS